MEDYKQDIGLRLKQARKSKNFTQEQISEALGISQKHYSEVERGITGLSVGHFIQLSDLLSISLDYLLKGIAAQKELEPPPPPPPSLIDTLYNDSSEYMQHQMLRMLQIMKEIEAHTYSLQLSKLSSSK